MSRTNLKTLPYCYFIGWSKLNKFYYGVKFAYGCHPDTFWKNYFTSSVLAKKYRKDYGNPDIVEIRKIFYPEKYGSVGSARCAAVKHENVVIRRMKMVERDIFLNCANTCPVVGEVETNALKYRREKFNGQYHSTIGIEAMRKHNQIYSKLHNPMHRPEVKLKHLDSIARKIGYKNHQEYLNTVTATFEKHKSIKGTSDELGHTQHILLRLLTKHYGVDKLNEIRKSGEKDRKIRQVESLKSNPNRIVRSKELNWNASKWIATSPTGEEHEIYGNRLEFCKSMGISSKLDAGSAHLRKGWEFKKISKLNSTKPLKEKSYNKIYQVFLFEEKIFEGNINDTSTFLIKYTNSSSKGVGIVYEKEYLKRRNLSVKSIKKFR